MKLVWMIPVTVAFAACLAAPVWCCADEDPVDQARQVFAEVGDFPWYDDQQDQLQPVDVRADPADAANRQSSWNFSWEPPEQKQRKQSNRKISAWFFRTLQVLLWVFLALLLTGLVAALVWAYLRGESSATDSQPPTESEARSFDADRVESLPFQLDRPADDFFATARRLYQEGNYAQAIIYLFSYQLLQLDRSQLIQLARGKTNRQYLRELRQQPGLRGILETTMVAFEDVFFGRHALQRDRFEACWNQLETFHQQLEPGT